MRMLKENDRIVDWEGDEGTATNVHTVEDGTVLFDMIYDNGESRCGYYWSEGTRGGEFRYQRPAIDQ